MRALIVDDEPLARRGLRLLLSAFADVEVVGEAASVSAAAGMLLERSPDLLFLDVELHGGTGFELLKQAPLAPAIIFVTAYSDYAVRAFESEAVDYLLKPVEPDRLAVSIERVRRRAARPRLALRVDGSIRIVDLDTIESIEAAGNYCCLHLPPGPLIVRETLSALLWRIGPRLVRIHKSTAVAAKMVCELRPLPNRDAVVLMQSGSSLRVSRHFRTQLDAALTNLTAGPICG